MQASQTGKFCPPTTNFSFQLSEEVVQNCSSRRKEALISRGFEPRYLGGYEVLELARNFSFYFPPPGVASPHISNQDNGIPENVFLKRIARINANSNTLTRHAEIG
jgi:hypothetical protein